MSEDKKGNVSIAFNQLTMAYNCLEDVWKEWRNNDFYDPVAEGMAVYCQVMINRIVWWINLSEEERKKIREDTK